MESAVQPAFGDVCVSSSVGGIRPSLVFGPPTAVEARFHRGQGRRASFLVSPIRYCSLFKVMAPTWRRTPWLTAVGTTSVVARLLNGLDWLRLCRFKSEFCGILVWNELPLLFIHCRVLKVDFLLVSVRCRSKLLRFVERA